jgi:hypothetical protein
MNRIDPRLTQERLRGPRKTLVQQQLHTA